MTFNVLRITEIIETLQQGITEPSLCRADDGQLYVVKSWQAGRESLIAEWIAGQLARALDLPLPPFEQVYFEKAQASYAAHPAAQHLARMPGFGSRYVGDNIDFPLSTVATVPQDLRTEILWFDRLISNGDRNDGNPNLLWDPADSKLWLIDHNNAFRMPDAPKGFFATHVFRQDGNLLSESVRASILPKFQRIIPLVGEIWQELPDEWTDGCLLTRGHVDVILRRCLHPDFWKLT